tara:strand:+ start:27764 stop:28093 length:330 start_codon:yes stop_codon:yes gene_type:complete
MAKKTAAKAANAEKGPKGHSTKKLASKVKQDVKKQSLIVPGNNPLEATKVSGTGLRYLRLVAYNHPKSTIGKLAKKILDTGVKKGHIKGSLNSPIRGTAAYHRARKKKK